MRFSAVVAVVFVGAMLTGCTMTLPVHGLVQNSDETFSGTATGGMDGSGTLTIVSNKGATCKGNFVYVTRRTGEGVFSCSDGRSGPFQFVPAPKEQVRAASVARRSPSHLAEPNYS